MRAGARSRILPEMPGIPAARLPLPRRRPAAYSPPAGRRGYAPPPDNPRKLRAIWKVSDYASAVFPEEPLAAWRCAPRAAGPGRRRLAQPHTAAELVLLAPADRGERGGPGNLGGAGRRAGRRGPAAPA